MDHELKIEAPLNHPSYDGHFPGHPVVPGVLLLDLVVAAFGRGAPRVIGNVKFHRAVKPGESFAVRYRLTGAQLAFRCVSGERLLAEGSLSFDPVSPTPA
jgi:3-hydroxymyristoyl/3-hydroxydecanoyl-(acyl carrier protein) dehydratase